MKPRHPVKRRGLSRKQGFALVLILSLMAFLVLLVVSIATLSKIETSSSQVSNQRLMARKNALYALDMALAKLQDAAGPDQRVTARAEILGELLEQPGNRYWTGVWNTTDPDGDAVWLTSSGDDYESVNTPTPAENNPDGVILLGMNSVSDPADRIILLKRNVNDADPADGRYAWWVSDEGVKASLARVDRTEVLLEKGYSEVEVNKLRQQTGWRPRFEHFSSKYPEFTGINWDVLAPNFFESIENSQFYRLDEKLEDLIQMNYHHVTHKSRGVLSNTANGGLKWDLCGSDALDIPDAGLEVNDDLLDFLRVNPLTDRAMPVKGVSPNHSLAPGSPLNTTPVIFTEFGIYFMISRYTETNEFCLDMKVQADAWNPYPYSLKFDENDLEDLYLEVTGLPQLHISYNVGTNGDSPREGNVSVDLQTIDYSPRAVDNDSVSRSFDKIVFGYLYDHGAGGVPTLSQRFRIGSVGGLPEDPTPNDFGDDQISISLDSAKLDIKLKDLNSNLLQEFVNLDFDTMSHSNLKIKTINLGSSGKESKVKTTDWHAIYYFKFVEEDISDAAVYYLSPNQFLNQKDFRSYHFDFEDPDIFNYIDYEEDPRWAPINGGIFTTQFRFFGSYFSFYPRIYDVRAAEPVSLGFLQHMQLVDRPPFSVGNHWGGPANGIFDKCFLSTIPTDESAWNPLDYWNRRSLWGDGKMIENDFLTIFAENEDELSIAPFQTRFSAQNLMIDGAFNINSTSVDAWKVYLGSRHLNNWSFNPDFYKAPFIGRSREHVKNGIFRMSLSADQIARHPSQIYSEYPEIDASDKESFYKDDEYSTLSTDIFDWKHCWNTNAMRELKDSEVDVLAQKIVLALKTRGKPLFSFEDLLNSAFFEDAIARTSINTVDGQIYDSSENRVKMPYNAPAFVSQADLMSQLAPFATLRSDTFSIRCYGETTNPVTLEPAGKAYCEAVVQRLPEETKFSTDNNVSRIFKIVRFRWLNADDI